MKIGAWRVNNDALRARLSVGADNDIKKNFCWLERFNFEKVESLYARICLQIMAA